MPSIEMQPIESSQIHSIGYDAQSQTLAVRFKSRDGAPTSLYHYYDVNQANFDAFKNAESHGSHFYRHIKPFPERFPYVCIEKMPNSEPTASANE
ncbi:KTSC domain-containing protein [Burkholderia multivorans]|uniref:KTSC domain-containing protein n=1 Tax=Burkholderia multivorans TaxID=87883 RepID=UPI001C217A36|nr:KTSC domain-containing protein [Burkholderia multivorans]MBU9618114.1 KTSC domain-containing protein [Burkholderia multivorans]